MAKPKLMRKWPLRTIIWSVGVVAWLGVLFGVAIPAWQHAVVQHEEVQALEIELAALDQWTVAGLWLEKSLAPRQAAINPQWDRLFPSETAKGELFLDLARVADKSGVGEFELRELVLDEGIVVAETGNPDSLPLSAYRVRASFSGQFAQVAEFLGGLRIIERAVSVHNLAIKPTGEAVQVDLELDVYVSTTDQS